MLPFLLGATHSLWCEYRHCDEPHGENRRCVYIGYDMVVEGKNTKNLYSTGKKIIVPNIFVENIDRLKEWEHLSKHYIEMFQIMEILHDVVDKTETLTAEITRNPVLALSFNPESLPYSSVISRTQQKKFQPHGKIPNHIANQIKDIPTIYLQNPFFGQKTNHIASGNTEHNTMKRLYIRPWLTQFHQKITKLFYDSAISNMSYTYQTRQEREIQKIYNELEFLKIEKMDLEDALSANESATDIENSALKEAKQKLRQRVKYGQKRFNKLNNEYDVLKQDYQKKCVELASMLNEKPESAEYKAAPSSSLKPHDMQESESSKEKKLKPTSPQRSKMAPTKPSIEHSSEDETIIHNTHVSKHSRPHNRRKKPKPPSLLKKTQEDLLLDARIRENMVHISALLDTYENEAKFIIAEWKKQKPIPTTIPEKIKNLYDILVTKITSLPIPKDSALEEFSKKIIMDLKTQIKPSEPKPEMLSQSENIMQESAPVIKTNISSEDNILEAVKAGNLHSVIAMIKAGQNVNTTDASGNTPLRLVSELGHLHILIALIYHGGDVHSIENNAETPLHRASYYGFLDIVNTLINHGGDIHNTTNCAKTPLHLASGNGFLDIVNTLIYHGAHVNAQSNLGDKPSMIASKIGFTPLMTASTNGHLSVVETLLDHGADINMTGGKQEHTALHIASSKGHLSIVKTLLDHGAPINSRTVFNNFTPLHVASSNGQLSIVEELIGRGADVNDMSRCGDTALHCATNMGFISIVETLLDHGADINSVTKDGDTSLIVAASFKGCLPVVKILLARGAEVNYVNSQGYSALLAALENWHFSIVEKLLDYGADVNIVNRHGNTPLLEATIACNEPIVRKLLTLGANIHVLNPQGLSPLALCLRRKYEIDPAPICKLLVDAGADVTSIPDEHAAFKQKMLDYKQEILDRNPHKNQKTGIDDVLIDPAPVGKLLVDAGADVTSIPDQHAEFTQEVLDYKQEILDRNPQKTGLVKSIINLFWTK